MRRVVTKVWRLRILCRFLAGYLAAEIKSWRSTRHEYARRATGGLREYAVAVIVRESLVQGRLNQRVETRKRRRA
jgi:hypothetical protein